MSAAANSNSITEAASPQPYDLLAEGARARKLSAEVDGVKSLIEGTRLVNDAVLAQVLFALWDSGFYEFSLTHATFQIQAAADELRLDPTHLRWLLEYLVGRGFLQDADGTFSLTDRGARLSNVLLRGTMDLYIGGYGPLLANMGRLLRREILQDDFKHLRSGRHTVRGTEQLICVRTVPAVLKILAQRKLTRVLNIACRTGQFLIELARSEPALQGIGIDKATDRVAASQANALAHGVDSRVRFVKAELGRDPWPLDAESIDQIDAVATLYFFHEVARFGRHKVVGLLRQIKETFPGRLLLFMETMPYEPPPQGTKLPQTFSQLDYLLIHRIRDQGLPLPSAEWRSILEEAGLKLVEVQEIYWSGLYLAEL